MQCATSSENACIHKTKGQRLTITLKQKHSVDVLKEVRKPLRVQYLSQQSGKTFSAHTQF